MDTLSLLYNNSPPLVICSAGQRHWCDVCRSEYSGHLSSHLSSTLHQFSLQHPLPTPYYCLPPSSNSYKMMVRCGWKPGTGLGLESNGPQQPVSTVLKRDQEGLGYGQMKRAKVTHFQARDHDAVKAPSKEKAFRGGKGQRREESMRKEQKDKNWERDYRASFYLWHLMTFRQRQAFVFTAVHILHTVLLLSSSKQTKGRKNVFYRIKIFSKWFGSRLSGFFCMLKDLNRQATLLN